MRTLLFILLLFSALSSRLSAADDKDSTVADTMEHQYSYGAIFYNINATSLNKVLNDAGYPDVGASSLMVPALHYAGIRKQWYVSLLALLPLPDITSIDPYSVQQKEGVTSRSYLHISQFYSVSFGRTFPLYEESLQFHTIVGFSYTNLHLNLARADSVQGTNGFFSSKRQSLAISIATSLDYSFKIFKKSKEKMLFGLDIGYTALEPMAGWSDRERYLPGVHGIYIANDDGNLRNFYIGLRLGSSLKF